MSALGARRAKRARSHDIAFVLTLSGYKGAICRDGLRQEGVDHQDQDGHADQNPEYLVSQLRQNNATGKSLLIYRNRVKPQNQKESKIFRFSFNANHFTSIAIPSREEGRIMTVTIVGWDAVDAGSADNERRESVRRRRVVLTPRRWRQVLEKSASQGRRWQESRSPGRA